MHIKYVLLLLLQTSIIAVIHSKHADNQPCKNQKKCAELNDNCLCYCSRVCGLRAKLPKEDTPVYIENDTFGHYCYCKPWDRDNFVKQRCNRK